MHNILKLLLDLFSSNSSLSEDDIQEDRIEAKAVSIFSDGRVPTVEEFQAVVGLNQRDKLHISILRTNGEDDLICNYSQKNNEDFSDFISNCKSDLESTSRKKIILTIEKENQDNRISVYYPNVFFKYLSQQSILGLLSVLSKSIGAGRQFVIFEVQDESFQEFSSQAIKFVPLGYTQDNQPDNSYRDDKISKITNLCHCDLSSKYSFIPDDFAPIIKSENEVLLKLFQKLTLFYSVIFLFDVIEIDNSNIKYKLNGYRTIAQNANTDDVDINSHESYYMIYSWVYDGGNIVDKIGLARNILSLNLAKDTLSLAETTFDAIRSGYNVYQKENIKQYIEIRNKISDQLVELQDKADKIVESFVSDYKKSIIAVVSFFISVIVIEVVSNGSYVKGFTIEVTLLSIGFLLISLCLMIFSRWEIKKELIRYNEFYENLKERHKDLLDISDINRILNNDEDFRANKSFIEERKGKYTCLWILSLSILFVIIVLLYFINNPCPTISTIAQLVKSFIICCFTKNT